MAGSLEGGNFYEDAILRDHNAAERREERSALDERLETQNILEETQDSLSQIQDDVNLDPQMQETLGFFEGIQDNEGNVIEGYDVFSRYMLGASLDIQTNFIDFEKGLIFENNIKNFGRFPVNDFEARQFFIDGIIDIKGTTDEARLAEDEARLAEDEARLAEDEARLAEDETLKDAEDLRIKLLDFGEHISGMDISDNRLLFLLSELRDIGEVSSNNAGDIKRLGEQIALSLKSSDILETEILPQAQSAGPEVFAQIREGLINLGDSEITRRVLSWEMTPDFPELPPEQMIRVSGALGVRVDDVTQSSQQSGNIFTLDTTDGTQISYDIMSDERRISLDGYSISSEVEDTGDYQTPKLAYMRVEQEFLPKINTIQAATQAIEEKQINVDDVAEIKATLRSIPGITELGIDFENIDDGEGIQSAFREKMNLYTAEITQARDTYRDELIRLRDEHAGMLAQRDKRVKDTLSLLQTVGVTQMPQNVFIQVSDAININPGAYGFETQIDLEQGILGFDASGDNQNIDRVRFAQMVNIMLGVEVGDEFSVEPQAVNGIGNTAIRNRNEFNTYVAEESGWHDVGASNTILNRLKNNLLRSH